MRLTNTEETYAVANYFSLCVGDVFVFEGVKGEVFDVRAITETSGGGAGMGATPATKAIYLTNDQKLYIDAWSIHRYRPIRILERARQEPEIEYADCPYLML